VIRLLPPRPTFALDMTAEEAAMMAEHVAYWGGLLERGVAIVFGPVGDPKGRGASASSASRPTTRSTPSATAIRRFDPAEV